MRRGGSLLDREYVNVEYTVSMPEKNLDLLELGPHGILGNDNVFIVRARKCAKKGLLGWRKTENPEGIALVDFVAFIVQSYFNALLSYVLSGTFCEANVLKVMDQKTLVHSSIWVLINGSVQSQHLFPVLEATNSSKSRCKCTEYIEMYAAGGLPKAAKGYFKKDMSRNKSVYFRARFGPIYSASKTKKYFLKNTTMDN